MRLVDGELLEWHDFDKASWKRVRYNSIVVFCDRLRADYGIADRRPVLSPPYQRHQDEDLLPFPLQDTMGSQEARTALGYAKTDSLVRLIEARCFEAYQFTPQAPWRVSRSSLVDHLDRSRSRALAPADPNCYKVGTVSAHF